MSLMRAELEQVVPTISQNPFLKNDQKRLGKSKSLLPSFILLKEQEPLDKTKEEILVEREHSVQRDCLKQELDQVLKGIKEIGNEDLKKKIDADAAKENSYTGDIDIGSGNTEQHSFERSSSRLSESSDITIVLEDDIEEQEDVTDNKLEEISAL